MAPARAPDPPAAAPPAPRPQHPARQWIHQVVYATGAFGLLCCWLLVGFQHFDLTWSDEPLHLMDAVLVHDYLRSALGQNPIAFAEQWYARFPCLGIGVYYPPLHPTLLGLLFCLTGPDVFHARLFSLVCVALLGAAIATMVLRIALKSAPAGASPVPAWRAAVMAGLAAPAGPMLAIAVIAGELQGLAKLVMLEPLLSLLVLLAVWAYARWVHRDRPAWAFAAATFALAAVLCKQQGAFLFAAAALHLLLIARGRLRRWYTWLAWGPAAALAGGYLAWNLKTNRLAGALLGEADLGPDLLGAISSVEVLAALGIAALIAWSMRTMPRSLPVYALLCIGLLILQFLAFGAREPRYLLPLLPMAAALYLLIHLGPPLPMPVRQARCRWDIRPQALTLLAAAGLFVWYCAMGTGPFWLRPYPPQKHSPAVFTQHSISTPWPKISQEASAEQPVIVLVDCLNEGGIVWSLRLESAEIRERVVLLRASKVLFHRMARGRWGYEAAVDTRAEMLARIRELGVQYILVEDQPGPSVSRLDWDPPPRALLRSLVTDDELFLLIGTAGLHQIRWLDQRVQPDTPGWATVPPATRERLLGWQDLKLRLYQVRQPATPPERIVLPIGSAGRVLDVAYPPAMPIPPWLP